LRIPKGGGNLGPTLYGNNPPTQHHKGGWGGGGPIFGVKWGGGGGAECDSVVLGVKPEEIFTHKALWGFHDFGEGCGGCGGCGGLGRGETRVAGGGGGTYGGGDMVGGGWGGGVVGGGGGGVERHVAVRETIRYRRWRDVFAGTFVRHPLTMAACSRC